VRCGRIALLVWFVLLTVFLSRYLLLYARLRSHRRDQTRAFAHGRHGGIDLRPELFTEAGQPIRARLRAWITWGTLSVVGSLLALNALCPFE
jgi:hypothetical protein